MTNELTAQRFDITVVGGGIAGLVAGITAAETGASVAVIDSHAVGGRARTTSRQGFDYNMGAHALYLTGHLRAFLAARDLDPAGGSPDAKQARLLRDDTLHPLTFNPVGIASTKLLRPRSRARLLTLMPRIPRMKTEPFVGTPWQEFLGDESDDVAGLLAMIVRTGTYVNAPATFDAGAALDQLKMALHGVRYVDGGWQTIVNGLASAFTAAGGTLITNTTVTSVAADDGVVLSTSIGEIVSRSAVIAGLGPSATERLTGARVRGRDQIGSTVHVAALDLALEREQTGVVFGIDEPLYLSPHAPVARVAPSGRGLVSLMRYVPDGETAGTAAGDRARLTRLAEQAGIRRTDIVRERYLHRLDVANGFPTARGGGLRGRPTVDALGVDGLFVAGDWVGPAGQLADAATASGEAAARRAVAHSARRGIVRV